MTFSWLGLFGGFWSLGVRGCLISLIISFLQENSLFLPEPIVNLTY